MQATVCCRSIPFDPCAKPMFGLQVLIADFFFVCLALAWLALGVGENATLHSSVRL